MSCWCGHGPWHYHGYSCPPPPEDYYFPPRRDVRERTVGADDLAVQLRDLAEQITRLRREVDDLRHARTPENTGA